MALNFHPLHFTFLSLAAIALFFDVSAAALGGRNVGVGVWKPIPNPKDPAVIEIGKFAITQHNNDAKTELEFEAVIKGETQVVSGLNYKLFIAAKDGSASHRYEAVVWVKPVAKFRKLTSFKELKETNNL